MILREPRGGARKRRKATQQPLKVYIIAYEDNNAAPQYFQELRRQLLYEKGKGAKIDIISLNRPKGHTESAPKHVFQMLKAYKSSHRLQPQDEFWMVVDRDQWEFNHWVNKCHKEGNFYIAISNPCFEFWLLLHHFNIADFDQAELLENRKLGKRRRFVDHYLDKHLAKGYQKSKILPERFLKDDFLHHALDQARCLDQGDILDVLGSHNYKLIEKLLGQ